MKVIKGIIKGFFDKLLIIRPVIFNKNRLIQI